MNVTYCDLCQKPINGREYQMTLQEKGLFSNPLTARTYDLCENCYIVLADVMEHKTDEISDESKNREWVKKIWARWRRRDED